jgi:L-2-hydroxyglutarate oxidase LhgO
LEQALMESVDVVVVGAGAVGLACARALALAGREVLVLEAQAAIGSGVSARSSEVIHAGIYYPHGSLKAQLCVRGKHLLYDYCAERGIAHRRCGKLIVATSADQHEALIVLQQRAASNGVADLALLSGADAKALEPEVRCESALLSPSSGIVDSHGLMLNYLGDVEHAGGMLVKNTAALSAAVTAHGIILHTQDRGSQQELQLRARLIVNAASLHAPDLARKIDGFPGEHIPTAFFAKGSYFNFGAKPPFSHLIYPVPEAAGLGIHLTLDLGGRAKFGPDVEWLEGSDSNSLNYDVDESRAGRFYAQIRKYWPQLPEGSLTPAYSGIRPKIHGPGQDAADFFITGPKHHGVPGVIQLFGIESPGLTASMAIGEYVAQLAA